MERIPETELMDDRAHAEAYAASNFTIPHNEFVAQFRSTFPDFRGGVVADLGCGPADVTIRMAEAFPNAYFIGIDGSDVMLELGQRAVEKAGLSNRIRLEKRWLPSHGYRGPIFDAVISNSLLHQLHRPAGLWLTVKDLAYPDAPVFVKDLTRPATPRRAQELVRKHAKGEPALMRRDFYNSLRAAFRPEEVIGQLQEQGLNNFHVEVVSDRHMIIFGRSIREEKQLAGSRLFKNAPLNFESMIVLRQAQAVAFLSHMGTEHLVYGLTTDPAARSILARVGINPVTLASEVMSYIDQDTNEPETEDGVTETAVEVLRLANERSGFLDREKITTQDLLLGLIQSKVGMGFWLMLGSMKEYKDLIPYLHTDPESLQVIKEALLEKVRSEIIFDLSPL